MAASVGSAAVVFMLLLFCPVFSYIPAISFTRDELLDIRQYTTPVISPVFNYSDVLLDIVVDGAAVLFRRFRTRRRGKRAGALVKLKRGFRTALPSIHLANLRSLPNKTDELLLSRTNKDFSNSGHSGQGATSAELSAIQSGLRRRINGEIVWRWDMLLHQRKVV